MTTEALRHLQIAEWIVLACLWIAMRGRSSVSLRIQTAGSRGGRPLPMMWPSTGLQIGRCGGRRISTATAMRCHKPDKGIEEMLKLPRSTAGRWIAAAREAGYLGHSEGMGKAGW